MIDHLDYIFPRNKIVTEGSNVPFCCIGSKQQTVTCANYDVLAYKAGSNTRKMIFTVENVSVSKILGTNLWCKMSDDNNIGTVLFVTSKQKAV